MRQGENLSSLASLMVVFQVSYGKLQATVERIGLKPTFRLNGVPYYSDEAVERIRLALARPTRSKQLAGAGLGVTFPEKSDFSGFET